MNVKAFAALMILKVLGLVASIIVLVFAVVSLAEAKTITIGEVTVQGAASRYVLRTDL